MLTLSIHQPEASLLISGFITMHLRSWSTAHRGPILIHASKQMNARDKKLLKNPQVLNHLKNARLHLGAVIGQVTLTDAAPVGTLWAPTNDGWYVTDREMLVHDFSSFAQGFIFRLRGPKLLSRPWHCQAKHGFFNSTPTFSYAPSRPATSTTITSTTVEI